ncbi:MAG: hypothetical protein WCJ58_00060 [bacterium]
MQVLSNKIKNFDKIIQPGDVLLTRLNINDVLRTLTYFPVGTFIAHSASYLARKKVIQTIAFKNIIVSPFVELIKELGPYVHIYRYQKTIFNKKIQIKYIQKLLEFQDKGIKYSITNVLGHLFYLKYHKPQIKTNLKTMLNPPAQALYNPSKKTCSQLMLDALIDALEDEPAKLKKLSILLGNENQCSFFPTLFPIITDYQFTVYELDGKYLQVKYTPDEILKLDTTWHPRLEME